MLRLAISIILVLLSLLLVAPAPNYFFWKLFVVVSEASVYFLMICLILLLIPWLGNFTQMTSGILLIVSCVIFAVPLAGALKTAATLPAEMQEIFGKGKSSEKPFRLLRCFYSASEKREFRTLNYKSVNNDSLTMDFYPAAGIVYSPCVIVVHGGSWASGNSSEIASMNSFLTGKGYSVASINYRLAPEFHSPAPNEDLADAISFLRSKADELGIDAGNFILLGRSAGGQIVLFSAYTNNDPGIRGVIAYYPPADMVWGYHNPGNPLVLDSKKVLNEYAGGSPDQVPQLLEKCSPIAFAGPHCPPTLLLHGQKDIMVAYAHSTRLQKKLNASGVKNYLLTLPWATHGFDYFPSGPGGQLSRYAIIEFLDAVSVR